jgi:hypothetical protein
MLRQWWRGYLWWGCGGDERNDGCHAKTGLSLSKLEMGWKLGGNGCMARLRRREGTSGANEDKSEGKKEGEGIRLYTWGHCPLRPIRPGFA